MWDPSPIIQKCLLCPISEKYLLGINTARISQRGPAVNFQQISSLFKNGNCQRPLVFIEDLVFSFAVICE